MFPIYIVYILYTQCVETYEVMWMNMRVAKMELKEPPKIKLGSLVVEAMLLIGVSILLVNILD